MKTRYFAPAVASLAFLACTAGGSAKTDSATIVNSGSTNIRGYRIEIFSTGSARVAPAGASATAKRVSVNLASRFFSHLRRAGNLSRLAGEHCMKSASFGSTITIEWRGHRSPDLECASPDGNLGNLAADARQISAALGMSGSARSRPLAPLAEPSH